MAKFHKPETVAPCIAALRIAFKGTFCETEIPCKETRLPLNSVCRAFDGIQAIVQILYANETERDAQGPDGDLLDIKTVYGLFEALVYLSEGGDNDAADLGSHFASQARGKV
jgi:hypothetical protein